MGFENIYWVVDILMDGFPILAFEDLVTYDLYGCSTLFGRHFGFKVRGNTDGSLSLLLIIFGMIMIHSCGIIHTFLHSNFLHDIGLVC